MKMPHAGLLVPSTLPNVFLAVVLGLEKGIVYESTYIASV